MPQSFIHKNNILESPKHVSIPCDFCVSRERGRDLTQSYDKKPYINRHVKTGKVTIQTTPQNSSITQRSRTDL